MLLKKVVVSFALLLAAGAASFAQEAAWPQASPEDVKSPSAVAKASYEAVSSPVGQALNLDRFRSLFLPQAQLISIGQKDGKPTTHIMTIKEFAGLIERSIGKEGHFEREIAERIEEYGDIAHVWSSYELRRTAEDPKIGRGINSIQLMNDGKRWWITGAEWQHETADIPLPAEYLQGGH